MKKIRGNRQVYLNTVEFDNKERNRYYGLRVGDIVEQRAFGTIQKGEVIGYGFLDNNRVCLKNEGGEFDAVAEWCIIITKVEDRK